MTTEHPITPPPELREQWLQSPHDALAQAARWGADMELEACCSWADATGWCGAGDMLRDARRFKPPTLKEQALAALDEAVIRGDCITVSDALPAIRRALESLPD